MITFVNYRNPSMSEDSLTFGRAASHLLTIVSEYDWVRVLSTGRIQVTVSKRPYGEYREQESRDAYRALDGLAWLLNEMLWAEADGSNADPKHLQQVADAHGKGQALPQLTLDTISSRYGLIRYCCEWLVGREIAGEFKNSEAIAGLLLAVQAEIDGEGSVEKTLAALMRP